MVFQKTLNFFHEESRTSATFHMKQWNNMQFLFSKSSAGYGDYVNSFPDTKQSSCFCPAKSPRGQKCYFLFLFLFPIKGSKSSQICLFELHKIC